MDTFLNQLSKSYTNLIDKLTDWLNLIILQLPNFILAIIVGVFAYFMSRYVRNAARKGTERFTSNRTVLNLVSNLTAVLLGVVALFIMLSILNLGETINKILATAGVLGLAVGLALQDPMNNMFSGVFMSVRDLFNIGDLVETNGYFGTIKNIDLRATKIMLPSGQEVVIPNKDVIQNPLKNYTSTGSRRVDISCGVGYGDDLDSVEQAIKQSIQELPCVMEDHPIDFYYEEFGGSSINFTARFWIDTHKNIDFLKAKSEAVKLIKRTIDENGFTIPFPIRTLDFGIEGGKPLDEMLKNIKVNNRTNSKNNIKQSASADFS